MGRSRPPADAQDGDGLYGWRSKTFELRDIRTNVTVDDSVRFSLLGRRPGVPINLPAPARLGFHGQQGMILHVVGRLQHPLCPPEDLNKCIQWRGLACASQCHSFFSPLRFRTDRRHVSQSSSKNRCTPRRGSQSRWCMSNWDHRTRGSVAGRLEVGGSGHGVRIVKPARHRAMPLDEGPQMLEVRFRPIGIYDEVSGHAVGARA